MTLVRVLLNERGERRFLIRGDWDDGDGDRNRLGRLIVRPERRTEVGAISILTSIVLIFLANARIIVVKMVLLCSAVIECK
jgi:hypothetical protein